MSALNLSAVMVDLAAAVQTVLTSPRTAFDHPVESVVPGDALVAYPQDGVQVSTTFRRGQDRCTVPVFVICGYPQDESTRTNVSNLLVSVPSAIESYAGTWSSVAVLQPVRIEEFTPIGGPPLVTLRFDVDVLS